MAIALLALALYVGVYGGFVAHPLGLRISMRSEWRLLLWVGIVLGSRHVLVRRMPLHRRIVSGIAGAVSAVVRAAEGLPDDDPGERATVHRRPGKVRGYALRGAGIVALFFALTLLMTYPQARVLSSGVAVNEGDALFSTWRLAWIAHQLPRDPLNLFHGNIFYPERWTLAFSDAMIVPALMAAPLIWAGVPQLLAYNLLFLSAFALSGAAMFLLVRSLTGNTWAAILAGFIFGFLPYRFMHYAHLELQMAQWMPFCLWALHRTVKSGRLRDGLLTGMFLALQSLSSWYYGIFLATFMAPVGAVLLAAAGAPRLRAVRALAAGGALAAVLIAPMALPYFSARENVGERRVDEIEFYSARPINYLAAHPQNVLFGGLTSTLGGQERELFMGFAVPIIALVALWPPLSAARLAYAAGLALAFDVSLGFNGLLYPWLHEYVLPFRGLRVPARMAMVVGLALAILAGYGAARLMKGARGRRAAALFTVLALVVFAEYRSVPELKTVWTQPPSIYDALPADSQNVLLELPLIKPDISLEPHYMYFSTFHWNALVNGYSGFSPTSYHRLGEILQNFPSEAAMAELKRRAVTHVAVHAAFYPAGQYERLLARIGQCELLEHAASAQWEGHETRLYRLMPRGAGCSGMRPGNPDGESSIAGAASYP